MTAPRRAGKRDANHAVIRDGLRAVGYAVEDLGNVGAGVPDLLVGWGANPWAMPPGPKERGLVLADGGMAFVEVKVPDGTLTPAQQEFIWRWRGPAIVAETLDDALAGLATLRAARPKGGGR